MRDNTSQGTRGARGERGEPLAELGLPLEVLVGEGAKGLSPAALGRLKAAWSEAYQGWSRRSLAGKNYA